MIAMELEEHRCEKCKKLLFRGLVGLGLVEVKCGRCGQVNVLISYDAMLHGKPGAYILVYNTSGEIIAASSSAEDVLGYTSGQLSKLHITDVDHDLGVCDASTKASVDTLQDWEKIHERLQSTATHHGSDGQTVQAQARYYPIGTLTGIYTIGIFYSK